MNPITNEELLQAANNFGTPLYVYDAGQIARRYHQLTAAFAASNSRFFYACKALTNINILKIMKQLGAGLDCVSIQEVQLGLRAGFGPADIMFTPNCVDFEEIEAAKALQVHINIDNISILERFGNKYGDSYPVCIRLNPHIMAGGNYKISTGHIDSKFGISIHQLRHVERIVKSTKLHVNGIHMHTGSEIKDIQTFLLGLEVMMELASHFPDITFIDLGSGFKVPYHTDESATDVEELGRKVAAVAQQYKEDTGKDIQFWFEPGKYLVAESGNLLVKANVIKHTTATVFVGVDSGFNHLIRPMLYDAHHHIDNLSNPNGPERIYTVVGNICETDTFAWDRKLPEVRERDILSMRNAGAYGFEMSSNFNSRLKPAEVLFQDGSLHLIRRRDTVEDLLEKQIEISVGNDV